MYIISNYVICSKYRVLRIVMVSLNQATFASIPVR